MHLTTAVTVASGLVGRVAQAATHGEGEEGSSMGPVAFLWPNDRKWDAADDNIGPCGSSVGAGNRTVFPLSQGAVALSIADEAYNVAFYIAFTNNPTTQSQFQEQIVDNITEIDPGHQCYKIENLPSDVTSGTNATIQLEYWSDYEDENNGRNETFYACADVTFVSAEDFDLNPPCFNVTVDEFDGSSSSVSSTSTATATNGGAAATSGASSSTTAAAASSGLSGGAKAGIAVGTIIGGLGLGLAGVFIYLKRRKSGYLANRRTAGLSGPIPLAKRNLDDMSVTS